MKSAIGSIPGKIAELMGNHVEDLAEAWANCSESEPLNISFSAKISIDKGKGKCDVSMSFTKEKVKDSTSFEWDDRQLSLLKKSVAG